MIRATTAIVLTAICTCSAVTAADRMNIVAIVTDDQATWTIGSYGNSEVRTPNIDRLGRDGAMFTNAFVVTPVCSPSRAAYLTGRYGTQVGITDYLDVAENAAGVGLSTDAVTWPAVLQQAGYRTALVGKWHLGTQPHNHPKKLGFDHFIGAAGGGFQPMNPTLEVDGEQRKLTGPASDLVTDAAMKLVAESKDRPFALLLHFREPHVPYTPMPPQDAAVYRDADLSIPKYPGLDQQQIKKWTREYYACVHAIDRNLGRLLAKLEELGLAENTIVLFTSDHGYNIGHHGIHSKGNGYWALGGQKGPKRPNMWDSSLRVPLIIRWPGVVKPGTKIDRVVANIDAFPTVLAMLGQKQPGGHKHAGRDFSPLLRGERVDWDDTLFGQYDLHNLGLAYMRMVRTPEWKLVRHYRCSGLDELYDLKSDPGETKNLYDAAGQTDVQQKLQRQLLAWMESIDDPLLKPASAVPTALTPQAKN